MEMGTNYYYTEKPPCEHCGRPYPEVHIGKSSSGWKFHLHALNRQDTWQKIKARILSAYDIRNEYGRYLSPENMVFIVESWQGPGLLSHVDEYPDDPNSWHDPEGYVMSESEFS
jgi:hypothetical protein